MIKKRLTAIAAALILIFCAAAGTAEQQDPYAGLTPLWVMCKSYVIVRSAPRKGSGKVGWIDTGEQVWTDGEKEGSYIHLCMMTIENGDGWVHAGYLVEDKPSILDKESYRVNATGRVALRRTINGRRRAWAKPGATLKVYMMSEEWALTNRGYIRAEYIEADPE